MCSIIYVLVKELDIKILIEIKLIVRFILFYFIELFELDV